MLCPNCKAEYRPGFVFCADCGMELVNSYEESVRHPLASERAAPETYPALMWRGADPHYYLALLGWLENRNVPCLGRPERPAIREYDGLAGAVQTSEFEVWVSDKNLADSQWILNSAKDQNEEIARESYPLRDAEESEETSCSAAAICPLCFSEFAIAALTCPNCGVPLLSRQPGVLEDHSARRLSALYHPRFFEALRQGLRGAGIPFNNANFPDREVFSGHRGSASTDVVVLDADFARATRVMSQTLQHWEFEPGSGFRIAGDPRRPYWPERASKNLWLPEDLSALAWSGRNVSSLDFIGMALREHGVPYRVDAADTGMAKIFIHPDDESLVRQVLCDVTEASAPTEGIPGIGPES